MKTGMAPTRSLYARPKILKSFSAEDFKKWIYSTCYFQFPSSNDIKMKGLDHKFSLIKKLKEYKQNSHPKPKVFL